MNAFSDRARLLIIIVILFVSGQVAQLLPLTFGWSVLAAGAIAGTLGFVADQWGKRRGPRSE